MEVCLEAIVLEEKSVLVQMMELYSYDFSEFSQDDLNEHGYFGYPYIDAYWNEEGRYPFFIRVNQKLAGFILVRSCCDYNRLENPHQIAEFFVLKKYRRQGVGKKAAEWIFDHFGGSWEVTQWTQNRPAQIFWKEVVESYTAGNYQTFSNEKDQVVGFTFTNNREKINDSTGKNK